MKTAESPPGLGKQDRLAVASPTALPRLAGFMQRQLDQERGVIARELHDELGGLLVAAKMDVSHALHQLSEVPADVRERLAQVQQSLDEAVALERRIVERLQPGLLTHVGLFSALRWYIEDLALRVEGSFSCLLPPEELPLSGLTRVGLYRILQDALERAAARPHPSVEIGGRVAASTLELWVSYGAGPAVEDSPGDDELRLLAMLQRAHGLGAELRMGTHGGVSRLEVRLPLAATG
jgi:signal transduction histidine kinase